MNVFDYEDYLDFLRANIRKNSTHRGYLTQLAKAAGCQKSYLSQVIKGRVHFTPEHAVNIGLFWNFNDYESEYFIQLVHLGRTSLQLLKNKIRSRLKLLKSEQEDLAQRFRQDSLQDVQGLAAYYGSWIPSALHVIVDNPELRTSDAIGKYLGLPFNVVKVQLELLERLGLLKREGQRWIPAGKNLHLPKDSTFTTINHQNWRARALINSQNPDSSAIHYTSVQTLSLNSYEEIKGLIMKLIEQQRKIVGPSQEETVACFTCDWFRI